MTDKLRSRRRRVEMYRGLARQWRDPRWLPFVTAVRRAGKVRKYERLAAAEQRRVAALTRQPREVEHAA
jgi:hypothetical protein